MLIPICLFCNGKIVNCVHQDLTHYTFDSAEQCIEELIKEDTHLMAKYGDISFHTKEVCYHDYNHTDYSNKLKLRKGSERINTLDQVYQKVFYKIQCDVIDSHCAMKAKSLHEVFLNIIK